MVGLLAVLNVVVESWRGHATPRLRPVLVAGHVKVPRRRRRAACEHVMSVASSQIGVSGLDAPRLVVVGRLSGPKRFMRLHVELELVPDQKT